MMKLSSRVVLIICLIQLVFTFPVFADEKAPPKITIDGEQLNFTVDPSIEDGTTLVQFRPIFEKLGLTIGWDGINQRITGTKEGIKIELTIGSLTAVLNGKEIPLQKAPRIVNGNTIIPLRFVGEASGKLVNWDASTQLVSIKEKPSADPVDTKQTGGTTAVAAANKQQVEQELIAFEKSNSSINQTTIELVSFKLLVFAESSAKAETVKIYSTTIVLPDKSSLITSQKRTSNTKYIKSANGEWKIEGIEGILLLENVSPPQPVPEGAPYVNLASGANKAVISSGESIYVQADKPTTLYLINHKLIKATMTKADYNNEAAAQRAKKLVIAPSDINKSLAFTTTGLIPGFYDIVAWGGNSIYWNEISVTSSPLDISVTNNPTGTDDTVTVSSLNVGDTVRVSTEGGILLGTAAVAQGDTSATVSIKQLGAEAGHILVRVASLGKAESSPTIFYYSAEK